MAPCQRVLPGKAQLMLTQATVAGTLRSVQSSRAWEVAPLLSPSPLTDEEAEAWSGEVTCQGSQRK